MADVDGIVIGSGAGGMAAAVALARAGQRVLVLEQHDVPGGWCHSFTLGGHSFSPGVHYVGGLGPDGQLRSLYEGLGVGGDLTFLELNPDGYDRVVVEGQEPFRYPKGREALEGALSRRFPAEAAGIRRYLDTLCQVNEQVGVLSRMKGPIDFLLAPFRAPAVMRWGLKPLAALQDGCLRDPLLKAILSAQCGDHGLPPSLAPVAVHAGVSLHYLDGAWYPQGGGFSIPRAFHRALKRAGGELRLSAPVARILVERAGLWKRRAVGVELADGTRIGARWVVSNADPEVTFRTLVGPEHLSRRLVRSLDGLRWSVSALSLFLGVDGDVADLGMDSGNLWWFADTDLERGYASALASELPAEVPGMFVTATTLKDPGKGDGRHHTMEAFTLVGADAFRAWSGTRSGERPADYQAFKERLKEWLLAGLERAVPGVRERVSFAEVGTPLTNQHYVRATRGSLYGTAKLKDQVGPWAFPQTSEIQGLFLCGASTLSHGVMGATLSGLRAASLVSRCRMRELLREGEPQVTTLPAERPQDWPEPLRRDLERKRSRASAAG